MSEAIRFLGLTEKDREEYEINRDFFSRYEDHRIEFDPDTGLYRVYYLRKDKTEYNDALSIDALARTGMVRKKAAKPSHFPFFKPKEEKEEEGKIERSEPLEENSVAEEKDGPIEECAKEEGIEEEGIENIEESEAILDKSLPRGFGLILEKEYEDAIPFRDESLLVVSDGLGGTGSKIIEIEAKDKERFINAAFAFMDYKKDERLAKFILSSVDDIFQFEKDGMVRLSNATFASRIILIRFAYLKRHDFLDVDPLLSTYESKGKLYIDFKSTKTKIKPRLVHMLPRLEKASLSDEAYLAKAMSFITYGLVRVAKEFGIATYDYDPNLAVLPATFAAAMVSEKEDRRVIDVLWAGDSRVYGHFRGRGLQQINLDDEGITKKMDNFICADRLASLHHIRYEGREYRDCILFACSDGIFDPFPYFDAVGVGRMLSTTLRPYEDKIMGEDDYRQWGESIGQAYLNQGWRGDDISMALNIYGFESARKGGDFGIIDPEIESLFSETVPHKAVLAKMQIKYEGKSIYDPYITNRLKTVLDPSRSLAPFEKIADFYIEQADHPEETKDFALKEIYKIFPKSHIYPHCKPDPKKASELAKGIINNTLSKGFNTLEAVLSFREDNDLQKEFYEALDDYKNAFNELKNLAKTPYNPEFASLSDVDSEMESFDGYGEKLEDAYQGLRYQKHKFLDAVNKADEEGILSSLLKEEIVETINENVPLSEPSVEDVRKEVLNAFVSHYARLAETIIAAYNDNLESTSVLDSLLNATLLPTCRSNLLVEKNWERDKDFYSRLVRAQEEAQSLLSSKVEIK